jgi:putative methionine-R-sulfoxide reductase with GAF domain
MMSLTPIWTIEIAGNVALLLISVSLLYNISRIMKLRPGTPLWQYLQWQVYALSVFALSHSTAHILRRVLLGMDRPEVWNAISPYTGGINSVAFVVVGILSFLYKDIESAMERMGSLQEAKSELEFSISMLKESSLQMEKDASEILRKNKELAALNKIALSVSRSLELDKVLASIVTVVREFLGADFMGIYMVDGGEVELKVWEGMSDEFREKVEVLDPEEPWLKRLVLAGKPLFRKEDAEEQAGRIDAGIKAEGIRAWAAIPLIAKDRVLGLLTVGSTRYEGLEQEQMDTLVTIGSYAGVVVESSMLYEELRQKVNDLERFRKLSVGREMRIVELKERLKGLEGGKKAG